MYRKNARKAQIIKIQTQPILIETNTRVPCESNKIHFWRFYTLQTAVLERVELHLILDVDDDEDTSVDLKRLNVPE